MHNNKLITVYGTFSLYLYQSIIQNNRSNWESYILVMYKEFRIRYYLIWSRKNSSKLICKVNKRRW
jgi:hypothetical protein